MSYLTHTYEVPDDMPAHIKAALLPSHLSIPVSDGALCLGRWQGIFLFEHRSRPHGRQVVARIGQKGFFHLHDTDAIPTWRFLKGRVALCKKTARFSE